MESVETHQPVMFEVGHGLTAILDKEDAERLGTDKWHIRFNKNATYVARQIGRRAVFMHRLVLDAPDGYDVDHINRNPLDNRKANLRLATRSQNMANAVYKRKGLYRGVWADDKGKQKARYKATLGWGATRYFGPWRQSAEEAARDYDAEAVKRYGEFARTNFPMPVGQVERAE